MRRGFILMTVLVFAALSRLALAQETQTIVRPVNSAGSVSMGYPGTIHLGSPIIGKPYSAEEVLEHTQTLADGTHIQSKPTTTLVYRDSEGRTRTERQMLMGPLAPPDGPTIIDIHDAVAGYAYTLDTTNHVAYRVKSSPIPASNAPAATIGVPGLSLSPLPVAVATAVPNAPPASPATTMTASATAQSVRNIRTANSENLGTRSMEGVLAEGQRETIVIPVGAEGNDAPLTIIRETWFSQQISATVYHKNSDPRTGDRITQLTNIVVGDPDPALFQVPADYQIVDESGPFQIRFSYTPKQN